MIVGGAELFVEEVVTVAEALGVSALVLSLVLAPLATELPEKLNSVLWMRRDKDTLAVGNITGAMAFQSTVPIAFGLAVTDWDLDRYAVAAGVAGLAGGALALWRLPQGQAGDTGGGRLERPVRRLRRLRRAGPLSREKPPAPVWRASAGWLSPHYGSGRGNPPASILSQISSVTTEVFDRLLPRQLIGHLDNPPDQIQRKQHENNDDEDGDDGHGLPPF